MKSDFVLSNISAANFSVTKEVFSLTTELRSALGFDNRNEVARLAICISMSQKSYPEEEYSKLEKSIKGDILFVKEDLPLWAGLLITNYHLAHRSKNHDMTLPLFQSIVRSHWSRGVKILAKHWKEEDKDFGKFWNKIISTYTTIPNSISDDNDDEFVEPDIISADGAIRLVLGNIISKSGDDALSFEHILNGSGYSPHVAIMGQVGTGKTRVMIEILKQIKAQSNCPIILVDMGKGDLGKKSDLINLLDAKVISVPDEPIPLDMFRIVGKSKEDAALAAMENFRDALTSLAGYNVGPKQKNCIADVALQIFKKHDQVTLNDLKNGFDRFYADNNIKEDSITSIMSDLTRRDLFVPTYSPSEFFQKNWILTFGEARNEAKTFSICILLSCLDFYLKSLNESPLKDEKYRTLRLVLGIDEARNLLSYRHPALSENIRLHRSKGLSVILASQSPDDYDGKTDDFLSNISLPICLRTNARSTKTLRNMLNGDVQLSNLRTECAYTTQVSESNTPVMIRLKFTS